MLKDFTKTNANIVSLVLNTCESKLFLEYKYVDQNVKIYEFDKNLEKRFKNTYRFCDGYKFCPRLKELFMNRSTWIADIDSNKYRCQRKNNFTAI